MKTFNRDGDGGDEDEGGERDGGTKGGGCRTNRAAGKPRLAQA